MNNTNTEPLQVPRPPPSSDVSGDAETTQSSETTVHTDDVTICTEDYNEEG